MNTNNQAELVEPIKNHIRDLLPDTLNVADLGLSTDLAFGADLTSNLLHLSSDSADRGTRRKRKRARVEFGGK